MKNAMNEIDIKLASEIAKTTVHEMAQLKETKTNKTYLTVTMIIAATICLVCIFFTSFIGIKMIDFMSSFEIVAEEEKIDLDATSDSGNASNIYNNNSAGSNINVNGDK